jgi:transposase
VIHKVKSLYNDGQGLSQREIAKELGISRNTVRKYLSLDETSITMLQDDTSREKTLDDYREYIIHLLKTYPNLSAVKILRKLKAKVSELSISDRSVRRYVEKLKATVAVKQARYYEPILDMIPGHQCQVDPGELHDVMINGKKTSVYFVVFVLSYSRMMYVAVSPTPINTSMMIKMHDAAFRYFGGCPEECVYDQTKLVVIKEQYRELVLNNEFARFATYAGFNIRACEGYDPESKGKVEAGVKFVENNGFYGEEFANWGELERYTLEWLDTIANLRVHGTTKQIPQVLFDNEEKASLKSYQLSNYTYDYSQHITRKVDKTGLISWSGNKYSVPTAYQQASVYVQEEDGVLVIFEPTSQQEIARHTLSKQKGQIIKNTTHYRDLNELTEELEAKIIEVIDETTGRMLCHLLKSTSPHIYKDQLRGAIKVLQSFCEPIDEAIIFKLCKRTSLTVTYLREYLEAHMMKKKKLKQQAKNNSLDCYADLTNKGQNHAIH